MDSKIILANDMQTGLQLKTLRYKNHQMIANLFLFHNELTVREIAEQVKLSKTSVNKIVASLMEKNIIVASGKGSSTDMGGKKPDLFTLNASRAYCISIIFSSTNCVAKLIDLGLNVRHVASHCTNIAMSREQLIDTLVQITNELLEMTDINKDKIFAISLQSAGVIDGNQGTLIVPIQNVTFGSNFPVRDLFSEKISLDIPIFYDNVSRYSAYYELIANPVRSRKSILMISSDDSYTGAAIISNGQFSRGSNGLIGELGHIPVEPSCKIRCTCGNYGCFETMISAPAVFAHAQKIASNYPDSALGQLILNNELTFHDIFLAADEGDQLARALLDKVVYYFNLVLYTSQFYCDPDEVIIQGLYAQPCKYFQTALQNKLSQQPFKNSFKLTFSSLNVEQVALIGGAFYCVNHYFSLESLYV